MIKIKRQTDRNGEIKIERQRQKLRDKDREAKTERQRYISRDVEK
jgi:hypothetical protein